MTEQNKIEITEEEFKKIFDNLYASMENAIKNYCRTDHKPKMGATKERFMPIPSYEVNDRYYFVYDDGNIDGSLWMNDLMDKDRYLHGNVFKDFQTAKLEANRKNLLARFNAFRDEMNMCWNPNWRDDSGYKYFIGVSFDGELDLFGTQINSFQPFGYFKEAKDAERAIRMFGDEIKKLFIDCECD